MTGVRTFVRREGDVVATVEYEAVRAGDVIRVTSDDIDPGWKRVLRRNDDGVLLVVPETEGGS